MNSVCKKISILCLIGVLLLSTTGCDKKIAEQKAQIESLEAEVVSLQEEINTLNTALQDTSVTEQKITTSLQTVDGKIVPEFFFVEDKVVFPNAFEVPGATVDTDVTKVNIGSNYTFSPSNNWAIKIDGSTLYVNHPSKIWGTIKAIKTEDAIYDEAVMKDLLQKFFVGMPATTVSYKKLYMNGTLTGMVATAPFTVEGLSYCVNVGFNNYGDNGISFLFADEDDKTGVQQELIETLLKSGAVGSTSIAFE